MQRISKYYKVYLLKNLDLVFELVFHADKGIKIVKKIVCVYILPLSLLSIDYSNVS